MILRQFRAGSPEAIAMLDRTTRFPEGVDDAVAKILADVRARGDAAVAEYTRRFDKREPPYEVDRARWDELAARVSAPVRAALDLATHRIRAFHERQVEPDLEHVLDGVRLELRVTPLARAGLYVPGGTALYPSSVLMTAIPAKVAGVREVVMVTPGASPEAMLAARLGVGDDQHLGRPGDRIDVDLAVDLALRRSDPRVAGPDDLVDPRNALRAVRERADRLGTAELEHAIDAGEPRGEHRLGRGARRHHHDLAHAGDLGRDRGHQHARRVSRGAAGHVDADAGERRDPELEAHAIELDVDLGLALALVERADPLGREVERLAHARHDLRGTGVPARAGQLVGAVGGRAIVELARVLLDGGVAAEPEVGEHRGDRVVDATLEPRAALEEHAAVRVDLEQGHGLASGFLSGILTFLGSYLSMSGCGFFGS